MSDAQGGPFRYQKFSPSGNVVRGRPSRESEGVPLINGHLSTIDIDPGLGRHPG